MEDSVWEEERGFVESDYIYIYIHNNAIRKMPILSYCHPYFHTESTRYFYLFIHSFVFSILIFSISIFKFTSTSRFRFQVSGL